MPSHMPDEITPQLLSGASRAWQMTPDVQEVLDAYRWRMAEAEKLLDDPQYFYTMFNNLPSSKYPQLIRNALSAYLRENRD